ncbi:MAG TPA: hypothetical protein VLF90_00715 [Patescibacteria group bacterium]|nr:hypothetical protein [Patescibacteria group bacterium]
MLNQSKLSQSIQTHALWYKGQSSTSVGQAIKELIKPTEGIAKLENSIFTFTNLNGETLVKIPTNEIKKFYVMAAGRYSKLKLNIIPLQKRPEGLSFQPYKAVDSANDDRKFSDWEDAFIASGVKVFKRRNAILISLLVVLIIIGVFVTTHWSH